MRIFQWSTSISIAIFLAIISMPRAFAVKDCGLSKLVGSARQEAWGKQRLEKELTPDQKAQLLKEFIEDGRDILVSSGSWESKGTGLSTVMIVLREEVARLTGGKVNIHYVTPEHLPTTKIGKLPKLTAQEFKRIFNEVNPQAVHLIDERRVGQLAAKYLRNMGIPYTTAYHTEVPKYIETWVKPYSPMLGKAARWAATGFMREFHRKGRGVLVPTETMVKNLISEGYNPRHLRHWSHGVDLEKFRPEIADPSLYANLPRPISLYTGRVESEKNIEDFLNMNIPGTKVVLGGGSDLAKLQAKYPKVVFLGKKPYNDVPKYMASADKFVFTSLTDTFGLVQLESIATGVPVVGYRVQGPIDVVTSPSAGRLADYDPARPSQNVANLEKAWHDASGITREQARKFAEDHSWERTTFEFLHFLHRLPKRP
jgi:glycosyltransferase involved in cell wall biosynthesis